MSLFAELNRRNVFKVALAYIVASWLVLQITDVLMSILSLPEVTGRFVFMLLVIGFIPVMVFAWAYEVTPEGIKRESEVDRTNSVTRETAARLNRTTIVLLIAVAVMVVVDRFVPEKGEEKGSEPFSQQAVDSGPEQIDEKRALTPRDATPSVAVLPFVNMSSDQENEYFSDGITEELLNLLVRVEGLRVPSRTSSFAFKGRNMDIRDIAEQLEVNHVLEGSVRKAGNQVRITAQLIDVTTDTHLWSETYDREFKDIFAIQDEIAGHIVASLQNQISLSGMQGLAMNVTPGSTGSAGKRPTDNIEAYNLYLQGLYQFRQRYEAVRDAEVTLRRAVELDPGFAKAWALLALNYSVQPNYLFIPLEDIEAPALEAAARAETLDPTLTEPHLVRGNIASKKHELLNSLLAYERSLEIDSNDALGRLWYGIGLLEGGYLQEAVEQLDIARSLDPAAGITADWQGRAHYMTGNVELAFKYAREGISLGRPAAFIPLGHYMHDYRDTAEFEKFDHLFTLPLYHESWKRIIRHRDQPEAWPGDLEWASNVESDIPGEAWWVKTNVLGFFGAPAAYINEVKSQLSMDATLFSTFWWPSMSRVRTDPAFKDFAQHYGLVELWKSRGWPELCRPLGEDDFECK